jgi:hypothetical protein
MRRFLGVLAQAYCDAASWASAAGDGRLQAELVERAWACLVQRCWLKAEREVGLRDVIRSD